MRIRWRASAVVLSLMCAACQADVTATPGQGTVPTGTLTGNPSPSTTSTDRSSPSVGPLPTAPAVSLLIDTDVAPDDLVAISFLVVAPNVSIAAITVSGTGEVHCPRGAAIVLGLLERLDAPDIPVACGSPTPTALQHTFPDLFRANADTAAGLELPVSTRSPASGDAVELIKAKAETGSGTLRALTLGPLTNLAEAIAATPTISAQLESVYVMGGAVDVPGNIAGSPGGPQDNTSAEWNAYVDPAALATVLDAGMSVRLVSLDGTNHVPVTSSFAQRVASAGDAPALSVLAELFRKNDYMTSGSYYLWDTIAATAAAGYPIGDFTEAHLSVDVTDGPTSGATKRIDGAANAAYMTRADAATVEAVIVSIMGGS
jgi:inosine-uridine nucleoside N-ribohydrolase